jgi:hypothetical protein
MAEAPITFTPDNEPFLGRESVYRFDLVISRALEDNAKVASFTRERELTPLQRAVSEIIPQGINLALSIRELVRQGYLFGAVVLLRPLVERAGIASYLHVNPGDVTLWEDGWRRGKRPTTAQMFAASNSQFSQAAVERILQTFNHIVHGDPNATPFNLIDLGDGAWGHAVGKNLTDGGLCDFVCDQAMCWLVVLAGRMAGCFPDVLPPPRATAESGEAS